MLGRNSRRPHTGSLCATAAPPNCRHLAQKVSSRLEAHLGASSLTLTIQDGPQAGQTVPHVHIHILPRRAGDFEKNDEIYDVIEAASKEFVREKQGCGGWYSGGSKGQA